MKYQLIKLAFSCLAILIAFAGTVYQQESHSLNQKLKLSTKTPKNNYVVGEKVPLSFEVTNISDTDVNVLDTLLGINAGYLTLRISRDGVNFEKYDAGWGTLEIVSSSKKLLKPNENIETSASVFWNSKPMISKDLSADYAKKAVEGRILTDYAFPKAGNYFVKAAYSVFLVGQDDPITLESAPVQVSIEEPVGGDLMAWKKIKDRGDIGYFIQQGDFRSSKSEEREKIRSEVENIINDYPGTVISNQLKQSLEKLKKSEQLIKETREKMNKSQ